MTIRRVLNVLPGIGMLYTGRAAGLVVGVFVLPFYRKLLDATGFGVAAVILSLQAFALLVDLGLSATLGRELAVDEGKEGEHRSLVQHANAAITLCYLTFMVLAVLIFGAFAPNIGLSFTDIACLIVMLWAITMQNLFGVALAAKGRFIANGSVLVLGTLIRAGMGVLGLLVSPTPTGFIVGQTAGALVQVILGGYCLSHSVGGLLPQLFEKGMYRKVRQLVGRSSPLLVSAIAGASVTQLDKPLIATILSAKDVADYYLATALCAVPMSILVGPVAQFFQPKILRSLASGEAKGIRDSINHFALAAIAAATIPSLLLWFYRDYVILAWMGPGAGNDAISRYASVLIPGFAIGSLGYIPNVVILSARDYKYQALVAVVLAVIVLSAVAGMAIGGSVVGVCWIYSGYHTASTIAQWWRASSLSAVSPHARRTIIRIGALSLSLGVVVGLISVVAVF